MNPDKLERSARWLMLLAGIMDLSTGLGLVAAPVQVLALMNTPPVGPEATVFLRWVGAFVGAVGFCYLWALWRRTNGLLRATLELTLWFRLAAGAYSAGAIATGILPAAWISVPITDSVLASAQIWLLRRGVFR